MICDSQVMYALAALDVPEALSGGPKSAAEIAPIVGVFQPQALWCKPHALYIYPMLLHPVDIRFD